MIIYYVLNGWWGTRPPTFSEGTMFWNVEVREGAGVGQIQTLVDSELARFKPNAPTRITVYYTANGWWTTNPAYAAIKSEPVHQVVVNHGATVAEITKLIEIIR